jgi:hypothetical protein
MTIWRFILLGLAWGLAMLVFFLYDFRGGSNPVLTLLLVTGLFLIGGVLFGVFMFLLTKVTARVAGFDISKTQKTKLGLRSSILIAAGIVPSVAIIGVVFTLQYEFLWVALAACLGPTLVLLPGSAKSISGRLLFVRCIGSVTVGALAAATAGALLMSFELSPVFLLTCVAYAAAWTIAQVISILVRPHFSQEAGQ